jgi:hypothetical protein
VSKVSYENRILRPYLGVTQIESTLEFVKLWENGAECEKDALTRSRDQLDESTYALTIPDTSHKWIELLAEAEIPADAVNLVVLAVGRTLRTAVVLLSVPASSSDIPRVLNLSRDEQPLIFGDSRGFEVRCVLALVRDLAPRRLSPHRAGTWLADRNFSVRLESEILSSFNPERLDTATRERLGLPVGTVSYFHANDSVLNVDDLAGAVTFYIDESVFDSLHIYQGTPAGVAIQASFVTDFVVQLLQAIARDCEESGQKGAEDSIDSESPAGSALITASRLLGISIQDMMTEARDEPSLLSARVQAAIDLPGLMKAALTKGDSA